MLKLLSAMICMLSCTDRVLCTMLHMPPCTEKVSSHVQEPNRMPARQHKRLAPVLPGTS